MRNLVIFRGPQGSGKSTLVELCGLSGHHLSFDKAREFVAGDSINHRGYFTVPQQHNDLAFRLTMESLERRMNDGETIAFEATLPEARDIRKLLKLAKSYRYRTLVVDHYGLPESTFRKHNALRPDRTRVADLSIDRVLRDYAPVQEKDLGPKDRVLSLSGFEEFDHAAGQITSFLKEGLDVRDLSSFRRIVHIGDIQGCLSPLLDSRSPLAKGLDEDTFYVFLGDLFDRGPENGAVACWWLETVQGASNAVLVAGNHEQHVEREAAGLPAVSGEWSLKTWPDLEVHGITRGDLESIASSAVPVFSYRRGPTEVLCTHGGLPRWIDDLHLVPVSVLRAGAGGYNQAVDEAWAENEAASGRIQVHGHRNSAGLPAAAATGSFNLEAQVEFGGHLRMAILDDAGWTTLDIRPQRFRTMQEDSAFRAERGTKAAWRTAPIMPWIRRGEEDLAPLRPETLQGFADHAMVSVKPQDSMPHVSSINFTKKAFFSASWDSYTTLARGMFIDHVDNTLVARSYPKFWNHGEREETSDEALRDNLVFPVTGYNKANGFLCITGYSERSDELIVASKSRVDGDFADIARDVMLSTIGAAGMEKVLRFNRDQKASLVFEIVDPVNDPHIIEETSPRLVLLGAIRRDEVFEQCSYDDLESIGRWLRCEVKERLVQARDWRALSAIMRRAETDPTWRASNPTEGFVFQDANGYQFKVKSWYYASWKRMRSAIDRILVIRKRGEGSLDKQRYSDVIGWEETFQPFLSWAETLPTDVLQLGIVELRRMWLTDPESVVATDVYQPSVQRDFGGVIKGAEALAARVYDGSAKPESVARFLERLKQDPEMADVLAEHPAGTILTRFVSAE